MSVDFTVPHFLDPAAHDSSGEVVYIPLSLLEKRVLENFDLHDESGRVLPMISRQLNSEIAAEILIQQSEEALRAQSLAVDLHPANEMS